jgi:hypothetical protein
MIYFKRKKLQNISFSMNNLRCRLCLYWILDLEGFAPGSIHSFHNASAQRLRHYSWKEMFASLRKIWPMIINWFLTSSVFKIPNVGLIKAALPFLAVSLLFFNTYSRIPSAIALAAGHYDGKINHIRMKLVMEAQ